MLFSTVPKVHHYLVLFLITKVRLFFIPTFFDLDNWTNLIYSNSYTDDDGYAYGVLGVYEEFVGDTITIYTGYEDNCYNSHFDSLKVIVN